MFLLLDQKIYLPTLSILLIHLNQARSFECLSAQYISYCYKVPFCRLLLPISGSWVWVLLLFLGSRVQLRIGGHSHGFMNCMLVSLPKWIFPGRTGRVSGKQLLTFVSDDFVLYIFVTLHSTVLWSHGSPVLEYK